MEKSYILAKCPCASNNLKYLICFGSTLNKHIGFELHSKEETV